MKKENNNKHLTTNINKLTPEELKEQKEKEEKEKLKLPDFLKSPKAPKDISNLSEALTQISKDIDKPTRTHTEKIGTPIKIEPGKLTPLYIYGVSHLISGKLPASMIICISYNHQTNEMETHGKNIALTPTGEVREMNLEKHTLPYKKENYDIEKYEIKSLNQKILLSKRATQHGDELELEFDKNETKENIIKKIQESNWFGLEKFKG